MKKCVISSILALALSMLAVVPVMAEDVYDVPSNSSFKSYMSYKTITSKNSKQYKLQENCITDEYGLRTYNGRYTIALGNGFRITVGDYVDVELSTGNVLNCVVGDVKRNRDTNNSNIQVEHNGNIVEFIVDSNLDKKAKSAGDISKIPGFEGYVKSVTVYRENDTNSFDFERFVTDDIIVDKYDITLPDGTSIYTIVTCAETYNVDASVYDRVCLGDTYTTGG